MQFSSKIYSAPMPYIIGVHDSLMEEARRIELGDVVILDVDKGSVEDPHDDRSVLPSEAVSVRPSECQAQ